MYWFQTSTRANRPTHASGVVKWQAGHRNRNRLFGRLVCSARQLFGNFLDTYCNTAGTPPPIANQSVHSTKTAAAQHALTTCTTTHDHATGTLCIYDYSHRYTVSVPQCFLTAARSSSACTASCRRPPQTDSLSQGHHHACDSYAYMFYTPRVLTCVILLAPRTAHAARVSYTRRTRVVYVAAQASMPACMDDHHT